MDDDEEEEMKEKSDIKPVIVKVGLALALSFAGFVYSRLRTRKAKPCLPSPRSPRSSDSGDGIDSIRKGRQKEEKVPSSYGVAMVPSERHEEAYLQDFGGEEESVVGFSPRGKDRRDGEVFHLPGFSDLVKGFDSNTDVEVCSSDVIKTPRPVVRMQNEEHEQEITHLLDTVRMLRERERNLKAQLLEFYGLREQESAVVELQNRLKLNNMEAKLFSFKIESLRAENQKLNAQVVGNAKTVAELEAARAKITLLKEKLRFEAEKNKEQILNLKQRVEKFEDDRYKSVASNPDVLSKLKQLRELEGEVEELKKSNSMILLENTELAQRLDSTQILASSVLEDPEADALREVSDRLRQENEELRNEIEQLQAGRCSDIEELVYLRWINACLRYELRNYQPGDGKTFVARDLSKTLSPKSEEKAKRLILAYAHNEGTSEREASFTYLDHDQCSSSRISFTDSNEPDESSLDDSSAAKTNTSNRKRFFNMLRKLARARDGDKHESAEECDSISTGDFVAASETLTRLSLDLPRPRSLKECPVSDMETRQRSSGVGCSGVYKTFTLGAEHGTGSTPNDRIQKLSDHTEQSELLKYAEALRSSRRGSLNLHRKSASYGF